MTDFWLCASLLLLVALVFLLIPVLRARRAQPEEDRTALNVALYQERLAELQGQRDAGTLSSEQFEAGRAEGARELLDDTEGAAPGRSRVLGKGLPLLMALLLPALGLGLYMHWGASDKVQLARTMQVAPTSLEEMLQRLEQTVQAQPDSSEAWYFLGRAYMAEERPAEAAQAFEKAVNLVGREPSLLGLWAQAQYFAGNKQWTEQLQSLADEALKADPEEVTTLGLLGIAAFERSDFTQAVQYWERLVAVLPPEDPTRNAIQGGIQAARERAEEGGVSAPPAEPQVAAKAELKVRVKMNPLLRDAVEATDSVFIFARAVNGPPMPLAVKRVIVSDLPVEVTLSDADAMMPQLKLSNHPQVQLVARISRDGNPTLGQWVGLGQPIANDEPQLQELIINQPDKR